MIAILVLARRIAAGEPERKVRLDLVGTALSAARPRPDRARRPALRDLGLRQGQARRARMDRPLAGDLADPRRRPRCSGSSSPGRTAWSQRGGEPLVDPGDPADLGPARRAHLVLLPVLPPGRALLRDAALPLDRARALGDRNRRAPAAALLHADPRRGRDPESLPRRLAAPGRPPRLPRDVRRPGRAGRRARGRGRGRRSSTWPLLLAGLGMGALASQLGSVTVSSVPDEQSGEVGGLQNTVTNLGISVGTALTGAIMIAALSSSFLTGVEENPAVPATGQGAGRRPSCPAASPSSPTTNSKPRSTKPTGCRRGRPTRSSKRTKKRAWSGCAPRSRSLALLALVGARSSPGGSRPASRRPRRSPRRRRYRLT